FDESSGTPTVVWKATTQITNPRFSPDGRSIAFIGGLMSDEGLDGGDLFLVPAAGGEPRNLTAGRKSTPSDLAFAGPSRIVFAEWAGGGTAVCWLDLPGGEVRTLWKGDAHLGPPFRVTQTISRDGRDGAAIRHIFGGASEVIAG